ncbi:calmodulin regulator protein PCP4 isoform X1 [Pezoporus occidentalis]|uniref:calmodulin regulator protein PCP4 isoform X1 n=1 Tax=Pezoporus occidentalis TaxID=407982 RepID=UPI002F91526B
MSERQGTGATNGKEKTSAENEEKVPELAGVFKMEKPSHLTLLLQVNLPSACMQLGKLVCWQKLTVLSGKPGSVRTKRLSEIAWKNGVCKIKGGDSSCLPLLQCGATPMGDSIPQTALALGPFHGVQSFGN